MENFAYKHIAITNKATYLEFRKAWKEAYFGKIQDIRKNKIEMKEAHRAGKSGGDIYRIMGAHRDLVNDINQMVSDKWNEAQNAQQRYLAEKETA